MFILNLQKTNSDILPLTTSPRPLVEAISTIINSARILKRDDFSKTDDSLAPFFSNPIDELLYKCNQITVKLSTTSLSKADYSHFTVAFHKTGRYCKHQKIPVLKNVNFF